MEGATGKNLAEGQSAIKHRAFRTCFSARLLVMVLLVLLVLLLVLLVLPLMFSTWRRRPTLTGNTVTAPAPWDSILRGVMYLSFAFLPRPPSLRFYILSTWAGQNFVLSAPVLTTPEKSYKGVSFSEHAEPC